MGVVRHEHRSLPVLITLGGPDGHPEGGHGGAGPPAAEGQRDAGHGAGEESGDQAATGDHAAEGGSGDQAESDVVHGKGKDGEHGKDTHGAHGRQTEGAGARADGGRAGTGGGNGHRSSSANAAANETHGDGAKRPDVLPAAG